MSHACWPIPPRPAPPRPAPPRAGSIRLEPAYWALSELHARAAQLAADGAAAQGGEQWQAPSVFSRSTTKYWVSWGAGVLAPGVLLLAPGAWR